MVLSCWKEWFVRDLRGCLIVFSGIAKRRLDWGEGLGTLEGILNYESTKRRSKEVY